MSAISDTLLATGSVAHAAALHGEPVTILTGPDAGQVFTAVIEIENDIELNTDIGLDPRAKRIARFTAAAAPRLASQGQIQTAAGKVYAAIRQPGMAFLTVDYELKEIVSGKDS